MVDIDISQTEVDSLIIMEKIKTDNTDYDFPNLGNTLSIPLTSRNKREKFLLDISRGKASLKKVTYQNRAREIIILMRLDIEGPAHCNPDGNIITTPHLHIFKEGYGDKWAYPLPSIFSSNDDLFQLLEDFIQYCNIINPPNINRGLFI